MLSVTCTLSEWCTQNSDSHIYFFVGLISFLLEKKTNQYNCIQMYYNYTILSRVNGYCNEHVWLSVYLCRLESMKTCCSPTRYMHKTSITACNFLRDNQKITISNSIRQQPPMCCSTGWIKKSNSPKAINNILAYVRPFWANFAQQ